MEIKSFKKKKNNKYEIIFNDGSTIDLYDDVIIKYNLLVNKKMDMKKFEEIISYNSNLDAYYLSLKYLNSKMRTKLEIIKYLEKKEFDKKIINQTINKLINNKVIDEELYIKSFINDQINLTTNGPYKVLNKLSSLGIDKSKAIDYLNTIDDSVWYQKIEKLITKKIKANRTYSAMMLKNKLSQYLSNEGYEKSMINDSISKFNINNDSKIVMKEYKKIKNKLSKKYDGDALEFQIKIKMKQKGFSSEEIESIK